MKREFIPPHRDCFGCGPDNPTGFRLELVREGNTVKVEFVPSQSHAGYEGLVHGGIISLLFDEVMGVAAGYGQDRPCMSAELTVRFVHPLPLGKRYFFSGEVTSDKRRLWLTCGEARGEGGELYAWATGKYIPLSERKQESLEERLQVKLGG